MTDDSDDLTTVHFSSFNPELIAEFARKLNADTMRKHLAENGGPLRDLFSLPKNHPPEDPTK
jgi:hypothetical protein